jgi:hypothetical protein
VGWNCHSWLALPVPQAHCCTAVPLAVLPLVSSTQAPLLLLTTSYHALELIPPPVLVEPGVQVNVATAPAGRV